MFSHSDYNTDDQSNQSAYTHEQMVSWAQWYHRLGFNIVPLERPGYSQTKKPTIEWKHWASNKQSEKDIQSLCSKTDKLGDKHFEHGMLSINGINDIRSFDFDKAPGLEVINLVLQALGLPEDYPWVVRSGSGKGYHITFRCNDDITEVGFVAKADGMPKAVYEGQPLNPEHFHHVELRWRNSLTTLPPSTHVSNNGRYEFINGTPTEAPAFVMAESIKEAWDAIVVPNKEETKKTTKQSESLVFENNSHKEFYGKKVLRTECDKVKNTEDGGRTTQLNKSSFIVGTLVPHIIAEEEAIKKLLEAAEAVGLVKEDGEAKARAVIETGIKCGSEKPRAYTIHPSVVITQNMAVDTEAAIAALVETQRADKTIFLQSTQIVRIVINKKGEPVINQVGVAEIKNEMTRSAQYFALKKAKDEKGEETTQKRPIYPSEALAQNILVDKGKMIAFPSLEGIVQAPTIRPDGSILSTPGYDEATELFYRPTPDLEGCTIPERPTKPQAKQAMEKIKMLIKEFPFAQQADHANMLGFILTPFIRHALPKTNGDVLMALIDATNPGSGKGLLYQIVHVLATGKVGSVTPLPKDEEEWTKVAFSILQAGNQFVCLDNVAEEIRSSVLEGLLTGCEWSGRALGTNAWRTFPNHTTWAATGNNLRIGGDLGRRCYSIRLEPQVADPDQQTFEIEDLLTYVLENRKELVSAILTIIRAWFLAGCPRAKKSSHTGSSFRHYVGMLGGILEYVGVEGYLENLNELYKDADMDRSQWYEFIKQWHEMYKSRPFTTGEFVQQLLLEENAVLADLLPDTLKIAYAIVKETPKGEKSFAIKLGKALRSKLRTAHGSEACRIESGKDSHSKQATWWVTTKMDRSAGGAGGASTSSPEIFQDLSQNEILGTGGHNHLPHYPQTEINPSTQTVSPSGFMPNSGQDDVAGSAPIFSPPPASPILAEDANSVKDVDNLAGSAQKVAGSAQKVAGSEEKMSRNFDLFAPEIALGNEELDWPVEE